MHSDEVSFRRSIREYPTQDTPRLVFADWLQEQGDSDRAEFIRIQIALSAMGEGDPGRYDLLEREQILWKQHKSSWMVELPHLIHAECQFRRGFAGSLIVGAWEEVAPRLERILQDHPITELYLRSLRYQWTETGRGSPTADDLEEQRFWALRSLTRNPAIRQITSLRMRHLNLTDQALRVLTQSDNLEQLKQLDLRGNALTLFSLEHLLTNPALPNLTHLDLGRNAIGYERGPLPSILEGPPKLRWLDLSSHNLDTAYLQLLFHAPALRQLKTLHLNENSIGPLTFRLLIHEAKFEQLTSLSLSINQLGDEGIRSLTEAPFREHLHSLDLSMNQIHQPGFHALFNDHGFRNLRELNLSLNTLGESMNQFSAWPMLDRVHTLHLQAAFIGPRGAMALARSPYLKNLLWLDLSNNQLGDEGVKSLARSPFLQNLRWLKLPANQIQTNGANALIDSPYLTNLKSIDLWGNQLSSGIAHRLRERFGDGVVV